MTHTKKRMLITGVSGLLGSNLAYYFRNRYDILGLYHSHAVSLDGIQTQEMDLLEETAVHKVLSNYQPHVLIHCASLTNIEFCEANKTLTERVNVLGTRRIVNAIQTAKTKLVYISTDSVYDGKKGNYSETDLTNPLNVYGVSKLEGEREALQNQDTLILRTNIFGWNVQEKQSLAEWILHDLSQGKSISGFHDAIFSSIYTFDLARILELVIERDLRGLYNCGSSTSLSKYEFALQIAERFQLDKSLVKPISIEDFHFKAIRGKNLSLDTSKLMRELGFAPPQIVESLDHFYRDFREGLPSVIKKKPQHKKVYRHLGLGFIPYGCHCLDGDDIRAVVDVLRHDYLTQGPHVSEFEKAVSEYVGARFAVAVSSGTAALHIACLAAGVGKGDAVVTSPNTFVASANCAIYAGATPVFADIDPQTLNMAPQKLFEKCVSLDKVKATIPVHFAGLPSDMPAIRKIAEAHGAVIIEDASHALGATYSDGGRVGNCAYSLMTVFSFHPVKMITAGEGGLITTNDEDLYRQLLRLRSHGINKGKDPFLVPAEAYDQQQPNPWYYEMQLLGFNYRITDLQCALAFSQLKKLDRFLSTRREIALRYDDAFRDIPFITCTQKTGRNLSSHHLYVTRIHFDALSLSRREFMARLRALGVGSHVHYLPVPLHPYYRKNYQITERDYAEALAYYHEALTLPLFPSMSEEDIRKVIESVKILCSHAPRKTLDSDRGLRLHRQATR